MDRLGSALTEIAAQLGAVVRFVAEHAFGLLYSAFSQNRFLRTTPTPFPKRIRIVLSGQKN